MSNLDLDQRDAFEDVRYGLNNLVFITALSSM